MDTIIGKKIGMTRIFNEDGQQIPVTVIEAGPCVVVQKKTVETDGYNAVQLGFDSQKEQRLNKAEQGHLKKHGASPVRILREVRTDRVEELENGGQVAVDLFEGTTHVDVTATCKGRGFQGVVKRWGMSGGRASHGSHMHRRTGSIGQCEYPARVFKGKRMPGHMGNRRVTVQNLKLVQVRPEDNALLIRGAVPGPNGGVVMIRKALKKASVS